MLRFLTITALGEDVDAKGLKPLRALFWGFFILCHIAFFLCLYGKDRIFILIGTDKEEYGMP